MVNIKANVVPKISGNMQWMSIPLKNRFFIERKFKLADTLPQQIELSTIEMSTDSNCYKKIM